MDKTGYSRPRRAGTRLIAHSFPIVTSFSPVLKFTRFENTS